MADGAHFEAEGRLEDQPPDENCCGQCEENPVMDAERRPEEPGDLGGVEHVGRLRDGAGGAIPERAGGLALCTAGVDCPAAEEGGDVV